MIDSVDRLLKAGSLFLLAAGLMAGCSGNDGTNGTNGKDGAEGPTGPPGTAQCMQCHTDDWNVTDFLLGKETEFAVSKHGEGETYTESNAPCSGCHTTEGYQTRIATGAFPTAKLPVPPSHVGCFACHAPHTNQNFDLRQTAAVTLMYGGATFDKENSNTCAMCHQARIPNPLPDSVRTAISSSRWGPHHALQADYEIGTGAYVFSGHAAYASNHPHNVNINNGCVNCHMGPTVSGDAVGGHTFEVAYSGGSRINSATCVGCHTDFTDTEAARRVSVDSVSFGVALDQIKDALIAKGWLDPSGLVHAGNGQPGSLPKLTGLSADDRGAIFNYLFLDPDRPSGGIHNPTYERAVLQATLEYLVPPPH